jgi:hypothetical protein
MLYCVLKVFYLKGHTLVTMHCNRCNSMLYCVSSKGYKVTSHNRVYIRIYIIIIIEYYYSIFVTCDLSSVIQCCIAFHWLHMIVTFCNLVTNFILHKKKPQLRGCYFFKSFILHSPNPSLAVMPIIIINKILSR